MNTNMRLTVTMSKDEVAAAIAMYLKANGYEVKSPPAFKVRAETSGFGPNTSHVFDGAVVSVSPTSQT